MSGVCLLGWGWGQGCQKLPNFSSGLQLIPRRCSLGFQKTFARVPGLVRSPRRRVSLTLYDMQLFELGGS
jgi:hypothetical protein